MKHILFLFSICFLLTSCGSDEPGVSVEDYIIVNNLSTIELAEGVHIIIHESGDTNKPNINSTVNVGYKGTLTNGNEFDSNDNATFPLSNLIRGWQIGLPEIGVGGSCTLIIPPTAGYGSSATGSIPANSTLIFEMELHDITN